MVPLTPVSVLPHLLRCRFPPTQLEGLVRSAVPVVGRRTFVRRLEDGIQSYVLAIPVWCDVVF